MAAGDTGTDHFKQIQSKRIVDEQVRLLYENAMLAQISGLLIGGFLCLFLIDFVETRRIIIWLSIFILISAGRVALVVTFNKNLVPKWSTAIWHGLFIAGSCLAGAMWGTSFFVVFAEQSQAHQTMHFLMVIGVVSGGVVYNCYSIPVVTGFLSLILLPMALKLLTLNSSLGPVLGLLALFLLLVTLIGAFKINTIIFTSIRLRLQALHRENILKASEERYRHIFSNSPLGIFQYDNNGLIIDCNQAFAAIIGSSREHLTGFDLLSSLHNHGALRAIKESLEGDDSYFEGEYTAVTSGKKTPMRAFFAAIRDLEGSITGGVGIIEDFTEKRLSEQQIQYHQSYDSLTNLPNRRQLNNQLNAEIHRARRHGYYGGLLFIDLDNFKNINDSLGHSVGDELLKIVAARLVESIRHEDAAARMGGDEFVVLLNEIDTDSVRATNSIREIAEAIRYCLTMPCTIEGYELHLTSSIGVSIFPKHDMDADDILKQADTAMYKVKETGRNNIEFFLPRMQEAADERLLLHTELRQALQKGGFMLHYQPQYNASGRVNGAEALLRWRHPLKGMIPPNEFLAVAEETGIMEDIDRWVLQSACSSILQWTSDGLLTPGQTISVNISGKEFNSATFVDDVQAALRKTGANPGFLGIEITEGNLISTGTEMIRRISILRDMGITFSIDDFGTGYSSLSYLQSLPLHTLKIDRSFVNTIGNQLQGVVLVDTIIMMAHNLGLEVIAEGVENKQELDYLENRGCTEYQGYYFSKPLSPQGFTELLRSMNVSSEH